MSFRNPKFIAGVNLASDAWFKVEAEEIDMPMLYMGDEVEDWDTLVPLRPANVPHTGVFCDLAADDLFYAPSSVGDRIEQEFATKWAERLVSVA